MLSVCAHKLGYYADQLRSSDQTDHQTWVVTFDHLKDLCESAIAKQSHAIWKKPERMGALGRNSMDDYSRYIILWKLCTTMRVQDVTDTIELALAISGCDRAVVQHKPRLLSDNGSCYISSELADWLEEQKMDHVRGAPFHPQTQGKIERWHQTMKNRVLLENYYLPGDLERQIGAFVEYYNNQRYHVSLGNVTPADVYFGRDKAIISEREKIKKLTIKIRRLQHQKHAA